MTGRASETGREPGRDSEEVCVGTTENDSNAKTESFSGRYHRLSMVGIFRIYPKRDWIDSDFGKVL